MSTSSETPYEGRRLPPTWLQGRLTVCNGAVAEPSSARLSSR
jgi:hypothetical protein